MYLLKKVLIQLYGINNYKIRKIILSIIYIIDGDETTSFTLREIFKKYWDVEIGMYTQGGCFAPFNFPRYTKIGRYCSIARTAAAFNRNHPLYFKSTHEYFYSKRYCQEDTIEYIPLTIGNDVWIGHNAIILPNVREIGNGAVIAAGAVVNKDIPPYAIVLGNPARVALYRFHKDTIDKLLASKWWEKSIEEILENFEEYTQPYEKFIERDTSNNYHFGKTKE